MKKKLSCYGKLIILSLTCAVPLQVHAQIVDVKINDLISRAIETHPLVKSAQLKKQATKEGITAAKRNLLPTPSFTTGYRKGGNMKSQLSIRQPLWTGGRLTANVNQAIFDDKAAMEFVFEQQNKIAKDTIDAWQNYVTAVAMQRVYEDNLKQLATFEAMMQRRVAQGVSAKIELDLMSNRILQQQNAYQAAKEQEKIAVSRLEQMIGEGFSAGVAYSLPPLETLTRQAKKEAKRYEKMVFDDASFRNATVVKEFYQVESAKQGLLSDKASNYPSVYAEYTHTLDHETKENDDYFMVGMNYEPGSGFANLSLNKATEAKIESLKQSEEASRRTVLEKIQTTYQKFVSAKDKEISLIATKAGNQIVVASYRRQFIAGRKSWLEVLNALREQNDNKIELVKARATMLGTFYNLQVDLGMMPWQEFQFNREPQPLFHPLDPLDKWMNTQEYVALPNSVRTMPRSIKSVPNHLKNLSQKLQQTDISHKTKKLINKGKQQIINKQQSLMKPKKIVPQKK